MATGDKLVTLDVLRAVRNVDRLSDVEIKGTTGSGIDLDITDVSGNVILRLEDGHVQTKNFNSKNITSSDSNPLAVIKDDPGLTGVFLHLGCIGDSLSSGASSSNEGGSTAYHDIIEHSWGQYLAREAGITVHNFTQGGLTTKTWLASAKATQCYDGDHDCEAYVIALGENDAIAEMTIGSSADINLSDYTQNADTYYGNYGKIIQRIKETQPKAKIFVTTNPASIREPYNVAVRNMASIFENVYVIDLYTYGLNLFNDTDGIIKKNKRNGHYNAVGYKLISRVFGTYIDWIVSHNLEEFNQVELIGTNWSYSE